MVKGWGHDGCGALWALPLTSCPRHPDAILRRMEMPKITRYGGHSNAGLTERVAGFSDTTAATLKTAKSKAVVPEPDVTETEGPALATVGFNTGSVALEPSPFDPGQHTVADVLAVRSDYTDVEWAAVVEAERAGKNRSGITGA